MADQVTSLLNTDPAYLDLQRRQAYAQALAQQAQQPDQVFQGPMGPAAISPLSPISHGIRAFLAAALQSKVIDQAKALQDKNRQEYVQAIQNFMGGQQPGAQTPAPAGPVPPGGPGAGSPPPAPNAPPAPAGPQVQLPMTPTPRPPQPGDVPMPPATVNAAAPAPAAPQGQTEDQRLAQLLTMAGSNNPYIQQIIPTLMSNEMSRSNTLWQNSLPMSTADRQRGALTLQNDEDAAAFKNKLPMTAAEQREALDREATARETARYHNQLTGAGLLEGGAPNPQIIAYRDQIGKGNATLQNVPAAMRGAVAIALNNAPKEIFTPLAGSRFALDSNRIVKNLMDLPQYQLTAQGLPFLQRIDQAMKNKGSVSDQDLLDSFTKLNTAGNAITDAQVRIVTDGKSIKDWAGVLLNRLQKGGVLSNDQRQQIQTIAHNVYNAYSEGYQPVYDQAASQLSAAGVPKQFWTIPDLNKLNAGAADWGKPEPRKLSADDQQALAWANANPNDKRAAAIKQKLGVP